MNPGSVTMLRKQIFGFPTLYIEDNVSVGYSVYYNHKVGFELQIHR